MPTIISLTLIIAIGLAGSAWSVFSMLKVSNNPYGLEADNWRADPESGSIKADPYQKAITAISGALPLDANEAVAFYKSIDDAGNLLQLECTYKFGNKIANARFWTLTLVDKDGQIIKPNWDGAGALYSQNLQFNKDDTFSLMLSPNAHPGNWLPTKGTGQFQLVLRMYDTPIISSSALFEITLPTVTKIKCS